MISPAAVPRLRSLELENVRGFVSLHLDFGDPRETAGRPVSSRQRATVIVGRNGTNKSTLLRALALGVASRSDASALLATETGSFVRKGATNARITVHLQYPDGRPLKLEKQLKREDDRSDLVLESEGPSAEELNLLVCGYGSARGITGTDSGRNYRVFDAVSTLFDYRRELLSSELTLRRLSEYLGPNRFQMVLSRFARAMGLPGDDPRIEFGHGGGVTISADEVGEQIPLEALADGYRVTFNWLVDLYGRALRPDRLTKEGAVTCLVLIDEIDQHLHPELQTRVVTELTALMPEAQYVLTTHSPLVALGAHPDQLIVLERTQQEVSAKAWIPDYRGFSPEDVLTDERLFATEARNPELEQLIAGYDQLADVPPSQRSQEEQAALRRVAQALREAPKATMPKGQLDKVRSEIDALLRKKK
jgi:predicted ATPase